MRRPRSRRRWSCRSRGWRTPSPGRRAPSWYVCVCMYTCIYVYIYIYIYVYTYMYMYTYIYIYMCIYIYIYTCICTHVYAYTYTCLQLSLLSTYCYYCHHHYHHRLVAFIGCHFVCIICLTNNVLLELLLWLSCRPALRPRRSAHPPSATRRRWRRRGPAMCIYIFYICV